MKKVFLSLPMRGRTDEVINETMCKMAKMAEIALGEEVIIIDTFLEGADYKNKPVACLGESIKRMQEADLFVLLDNGDYARGCETERKVAVEYDIPVLIYYDFSHIIAPNMKSKEEVITCCDPGFMVDPVTE